MSTTPADPADIVERLCGQCGFPIHRSEGGLRHFGFYTAHRESRCRDIMHAEIAALRAREAELQRKLDAACATGSISAKLQNIGRVAMNIALPRPPRMKS